MSNAETSFFDYACDRCGAPVCERVQVMNLALDNIEELYCLACLAAEQDTTEAELAAFAKDYVYSRECFKTPWDHFDATKCPKIKEHQCFCQDEPVLTPLANNPTESAMTTLTPKQTLDLRTTKCPLNFVKTKLALEKLSVGDLLEIWILSDSQSALNIPQSIAQEGHQIVETQTGEDGLQRIFISKIK